MLTGISIKIAICAAAPCHRKNRVKSLQSYTPLYPPAYPAPPRRSRCRRVLLAGAADSNQLGSRVQTWAWRVYRSWVASSKRLLHIATQDPICYPAGFALFISCASHLVLHPLHVGFGTYYKPIFLCSAPHVSLVVLLRVGCSLSMLLVGFAEGLHPWETVLVQACLSVAVSLALAFEMHSTRKTYSLHHPYAERLGRYESQIGNSIKEWFE